MGDADVCGGISEEATRETIDELFGVLLAASVPIVAILKPHAEKPISSSGFIDLLRGHGIKVQLTPQDRQALDFVESKVAERQSQCWCLFSLARAVSFRVELSEYQIRSSILDSISAKSSRKCDLQRTVVRLLNCDGNDVISARDFEQLLKEKLAITPGSSLVRIIFARITKRQFQRHNVANLEEPIDSFSSLFEAFVSMQTFALDSLEGHVRRLGDNYGLLQHSFTVLDDKRTGALPMKSVDKLLRDNGFDIPSDVLNALMKRFDLDGDGMLNYSDFMQFMLLKRFGVNVLSPFGTFFLTIDPSESMQFLMQTLKTRLFWLQHNDLFAVANSSRSGETPMANTKYKLTESFVLLHHFGMLRLIFTPTTRICDAVVNGEMIVVILTEPDAKQSLASAFQYRVIAAKRAEIPDLNVFEPSTLQPTTDSPDMDVATTPSNAPPPPKESYLKVSSKLDKSKLATDLERVSILGWGPYEIKRWIIYRLQMPQYSVRFSQIRSGRELLSLDECFLRDKLCISSQKDRTSILMAISDFRQDRKSSVTTTKRKTCKQSVQGSPPPANQDPVILEPTKCLVVVTACDDSEASDPIDEALPAYDNCAVHQDDLPLYTAL